MATTRSDLTLEQFFALPEGETAFELVDGQAVAKVSPQFFHASLQRVLLQLLDGWAMDHGRLGPEWAVVLRRRGVDWVPVPDLTYVSYERLGREWDEDAPCPVPADLVVEIISPDQTSKEFEEKAGDYLQAGVGSVWVVDPRAETVTLFSPNQKTVYQNATPLAEPMTPGLSLSALQIFDRAREVRRGGSSRQ
ncbi:Uma2 family endonuclease [Gloeobacter violaceus]|uniref:Glr3813 protein n=1 Tax=Gloeobacter violaceus (strain ATCC 29082 / PCC 7421) TaxID=251221 RepID=Q7NER5_GLOVI|nr:Uma2 family endonuclease [Gloeobacter violaceus]BAC91754.1 glr3813 [Gloeobacter violaceus PCC 7421]